MYNMRLIPWIEILERESNSTDDIKVVESYPFPDIRVDVLPFVYMPVSWLTEELSKLEDEIIRKSSLTRLSFILDIWHPKSFVRVTMKNWKYK